MHGTPPTFQLTGESMPGSGTRWQLPRRPWGAGWFIPFIFIAAGIVLAAVFGINGPVKLPNFNGDLFSAILDLIWLIGQAIPTILGLLFFLAGLSMRYGRTTVSLRQREIASTDRFGPLRWTRRLNSNHITGFEINVGTSSTNGGPQVPTNNVTILMAETDRPSRINTAQSNTSSFIVAWGYLKDWMQQLADELRTSPHLADLEVTTTYGGEDDVEVPEKKIEQPSTSKAVLTYQEQGLTFDIPPTGWLRGSKGIGLFALLWNGFILVFISLMLFSMINGVGSTSNPQPLLMLLFMLPFVAVGIGMAAFAAHLGKSRSRLVIVGSGQDAVLAFFRDSPVLKSRELSWTTEQLSHICVGDSIMSVNDQPIQELQIHPKQGKKIGLLAQLDDDELRWIAYELRNQLDLKRSAMAIDED